MEEVRLPVSDMALASLDKCVTEGAVGGSQSAGATGGEGGQGANDA